MEGPVSSLDSLPLSALSVVVAHCSRPDGLLRCCKATWRLYKDMSCWAAWMVETHGAESLHKLRHVKYLNIANEQVLMQAVSLILQAGGDPNLNEERTGFWYPSILNWAVGKNHEALVRLLLESGSIVDSEIVCAAAAQGNVRLLESLVNAVQPSEFWKCRDFAFLQAASGGEAASAEWLLDNGADVNASEASALFEASYHGHLGVVRLLIERGVEVRARNDGALVAAAFKGHLEVAKLLIAKGADVNSQRGRALIQAAGVGHLDMCRLLLDAGALASSREEALVSASRKGYDAVVGELLSRGVRADAQEGAALTAAVHNGYSLVVRQLVKAGCDVRSWLEPEEIKQLILKGRFQVLAAMEEEGALLGWSLGPRQWGLLSLETFCNPAALALERGRLKEEVNANLKGCLELTVVNH